VNSTDPIASPTLALLYLSQGHLGRARAIVDALLERDPTDGQALVLARRLASRANAHLESRIEDDQLTMKWQGVQLGDGTHLLWVLTLPNGHAPCVRVSSMRCDRSFGSAKRPLPSARGSAACCIARVDDEGFVPLAVANPCSWG
jgi:hypothetical protein